MYFKSENVQVYPSSHRNDEFNRTARLNTEENITNLVNRLTSKKSFIIDGLKIKTIENGIELTKGKCNINGYYFDIKGNSNNDNILLDPNLTQNSEENDFLILEIKIVNHSDLGGNLEFNELTGIDENSAFPLDQGEGDSSSFTGLILKKQKLTSLDNLDANILPIARYINDEWKNLESSTLIYTLNRIQINLDNGEIKNSLSKSEAPAFLSLEKWLNDYFIIDDGQL